MSFTPLRGAGSSLEARDATRRSSETRSSSFSSSATSSSLPSGTALLPKSLSAPCHGW